MIDNFEINAWRDSLALHFTGVRSAKQYLASLEARFARIDAEADAILKEFKVLFKNKLRPIYLHRSSNTAIRAFKWKLSTAKMFNFDKNNSIRDVLSNEMYVILSQSGLDSDSLETIRVIDFKRMYINYELNFTYNEIQRLKTFIEDFESWRKVDKV